MDPQTWQHVRELALEEIEDTLELLPEPLREQAQKLPVTFERVPLPELESEGIYPDTLGLFVGGDHASQDHVPLPPQIILYLQNLWEHAEADPGIFKEEVHTTYLHELGHYLGLDEDDLFERGLE